MPNPTQDRTNWRIDQIKRDFGKAIVDLLKETNQTHLNGKGKVASQPVIDRNNLRWTLAWQQEKIAYDLNVVASVDDDGKGSRVGRVWVHRHASAEYDFEGHTPTTRMRRLTGVDISEIRAAIEAEFK